MDETRSVGSMSTFQIGKPPEYSDHAIQQNTKSFGRIFSRVHSAYAPSCTLKYRGHWAEHDDVQVS